jgi:hypothetical protein
LLAKSRALELDPEELIRLHGQARTAELAWQQKLDRRDPKRQSEARKEARDVAKQQLVPAPTPPPKAASLCQCAAPAAVHANPTICASQMEPPSLQACEGDHATAPNARQALRVAQLFSLPPTTSHTPHWIESLAQFSSAFTSAQMAVPVGSSMIVIEGAPGAGSPTDLKRVLLMTAEDLQKEAALPVPVVPKSVCLD